MSDRFISTSNQELSIMVFDQIQYLTKEVELLARRYKNEESPWQAKLILRYSKMILVLEEVRRRL